MVIHAATRDALYRSGTKRITIAVLQYRAQVSIHEKGEFGFAEDHRDEA